MIARCCTILAAVVVAVCVLAAALRAVATAEDRVPNATGQSESASKAADKPALPSPWQAYFRRLASEYRMTVGDSKTPLTRSKEPVLKWSQPVRGGQDGAVYVWLHEGRPAVVGTFFIWPAQDGRQGVTHELHALSEAPVHAQWRDTRWNPGKDPIEWHATPDTAASPSKAKQAIEARKLARRFAATTRNRAGQKTELRLQPHPFFEYGAETTKGQWQGGSLFSIAHDTDTEVVLWLETRPAGEKLAWHYACARMSDLQLRVTLDDQEAWTADFAKFAQFQQPYLGFAAEFLREPPPEDAVASPPK